MKFLFAFDNWWRKHSRQVLRIAVIVMTAAAALRLAIEFSRLISDWEPNAAEDLKLRYRELHQWFSGFPVYNRLNRVYPPASYAILWPLLGWLDLTAARWLWAAASAGALIWLTQILVRGSNANTRLNAAFVALLLLSMNGTGLQIGHGQLTLLLLPFLLTGAWMLRNKQSSWHRDFIVAAFFTISLVKPTVSAPFLWMALFFAPNLRPAIFIAISYILLTSLSASFQPGGIVTLMDNWLAGSRHAPKGFEHGYGNLQSWLSELGWKNGIMTAPILAFFVLGGWIYYYRKAGLWSLLGVTSLFARMWTYHLLYDDMLIILPMIALYRIATSPDSSRFQTYFAGLLVAASGFLNLARLANIAPLRFAMIIYANEILWMVMLIFLAKHIHFEIRTAKSDGALQYG